MNNNDPLERLTRHYEALREQPAPDLALTAPQPVSSALKCVALGLAAGLAAVWLISAVSVALPVRPVKGAPTFVAGQGGDSELLAFGEEAGK